MNGREQDEAARSHRRDVFGRALDLARTITQTTDAYDQSREGDGYEEEVLEPIGRDLAPELADLVMQLGSIEDLPTVHLATGARITVDINGYEVSVIHETDDDDGHYLRLQGQNCDLSGEMPGTYYPEPRDT